MQFALTGFTPDSKFRVFAFQGIGADQKRTPYTVTADLSRIRIYGIMVQDLPLLCVALLEQRSAAGPLQTSLTLSEADMQVYADHRAADRAEADRRKSLRKTPPRRPATEAGRMEITQ